MISLSTRLLPMIPLALLMACGSSGPTGPAVAAGVSVLSGGNQVGPVGATLPQPVVVQVSSSHGGGLASATVTFSVGSSGGGLSKGTATTDATGTASVIWTLGPAIGTQQLTVSAGTGVSTAVSAEATTGPAALLATVAGNSQFAVVGTAVAIRPRISVTDAFGNPIVGQTVTFTPGQGSGVVTGGTQVTDAAGMATVGGWTLGPNAGSNFMTVSAGALTGQFLGIGIPAVVTATQGNNQTANAGTTTPIAPTIAALDGQGNGLPGVQVSFQPAAGSGFVLGNTTVTTNAAGLAGVQGWVLGTAAGPNTLSAVIPGVPAVTFSAQGVPAVAASMVASSPTNLEGFLGNFLASLPEVRLTDAIGNPVGGQAVTFQVTGGDGQLAGSTVMTTYDGRAAVGAWRLGPATASQALEATTAGVGPVTFSANATPLPPQEFNIELRYRNTPTATQEAAFTNAVVRWKQILLGDVVDIPLSVPASSSGCYPALSETVDDLVIYVDLVEIDGVGAVLGSAGPCLIRSTGRIPVVGRMRFDTADLANLETTGRLEAVILHEMGHVLGVGTIWGAPPNLNLLVDAGGFDPHFVGPAAKGAFAVSALPGVYPGKAVPVENTGGAGTRDSHWRETTFDSELMTGFIETTGPNPLSIVTSASMRDLGYVVNDAVSDPYTLPAFLRTLAAGGKMRLNEVPLEGPIYTVTRQGRIDGILYR